MGSSWSPGRTMMGASLASVAGASRWARARTGATTTSGARDGSARRQSTRKRRPMVSTFGLTRSNGSVSHAGNSSTQGRSGSPASKNDARSAARRSASWVVGTATIKGRRVERRTRPAMTNGRAASGTAMTALGEPARRVMPSSPASRGGREPRLTGARLRLVLRGRWTLVVAVHGRRHPGGGDQLDGVGRLLHGHVELVALGARRAAQHMVGTLPAPGRLADADPHAQEVGRVQVLADGLEPVVPGQAAALFHLDAAERQVELVVHDDDVRGVGDAVTAHEGGDGAARVVHVRLREGERKRDGADADLVGEGVFLGLAQAAAVARREHGDDI